MANKKPIIIKFKAQVYQIRTTIDGGANVTLSLSGKEIKALTQLLQVKEQIGILLEVAAIPIKIEIQSQLQQKNDKARRKERYPYRSNQK